MASGHHHASPAIQEGGEGGGGSAPGGRVGAHPAWSVASPFALVGSEAVTKSHPHMRQFTLHHVHTPPCTHTTMFPLHHVPTQPCSHSTMFTLHHVHTPPCQHSCASARSDPEPTRHEIFSLFLPRRGGLVLFLAAGARLPALLLLGLKGPPPFSFMDSGRTRLLRAHPPFLFCVCSGPRGAALLHPRDRQGAGPGPRVQVHHSRVWAEDRV